MKTIVVFPDNNRQLEDIKSFLRDYKISFKESTTNYNPKFVKKVKSGIEQIKNGETRVINIEEL